MPGLLDFRLAVMTTRVGKDTSIYGQARDDSDGTELWERVARGAKPLAKGKATRPGHRPKAQAREPAKEAARVPPQARAKDRGKGGSSRARRARPADGAAARAGAARGRGAARPAWHAAARRACAAAAIPESRAGAKASHVLVITGKGAELDASRSFYAEEERGVLAPGRAALAGQPEFAHVVVSYVAGAAPPRRRRRALCAAQGARSAHSRVAWTGVKGSGRFRASRSDALTSTRSQNKLGQVGVLGEVADMARARKRRRSRSSRLACRWRRRRCRRGCAPSP